MPTVNEIAQLLDTTVRGDGRRVISGMATLSEAGKTHLSFLSSDAFVRQFRSTRAAAVIVQRNVNLPASTSHDAAILLVDDADAAVATVLRLFAPAVPQPPLGTDSKAIVATSAKLGTEVRIGPNVVVGERASIADGCVIHANVVIGDDVSIGPGTVIYANVTIRERITIGSNVIINSGSVLGTDGFGYHWDGTKHAKIPQIGTVVIEDDVEIGSCVCIDRAKFSETRIGRGTKIDNLVQIAHNVVIGPHCIIVGQVGLAGSVHVGTGVVLGGQSAVRDQITLGDGATVAACSAVAEDVDANTVVSGLPAMPHRQSLREQAALRRLPDLVVQVRKLQEEIEKLKHP